MIVVDYEVGAQVIHSQLVLLFAGCQRRLVGESRRSLSAQAVSYVLPKPRFHRCIISSNYGKQISPYSLLVAAVLAEGECVR